jgi:hypothetical protein
MQTPIGPVIVAEGHDVELFDTVADAVQCIEPIDASDGIYEVYDGLGRRCVLRVAPPPARKRDLLSPHRFTVSIELAETVPSQLDRVKKMLEDEVQHLAAVKTRRARDEIGRVEKLLMALGKP